MSDGYTKLFSSITDSTIWQAPDTTRLVWITMLAMADQHGYVGASVPGLASRARVSIEDCIKALDAFQSPDKWSRTTDYEGRRIIPSDEGWILLNHAKYREKRDKEARAEQSRLAMARLRADRKGVSNVSNVSHSEPRLTQAEAEAEALKSKAIVVSDANSVSCPHKKIVSLYHEKLPMMPAIRIWTKARQTVLAKRWDEDKTRQTLDYWEGFFNHVAKSDFLCGRTPKPFACDLEWMLNLSNFVKIIEGKYD